MFISIYLSAHHEDLNCLVIPLTKVDIHFGHVRMSYLLDNIYVRFGTKLYRQIVGIPMGTNCAPLVADLFLYCYERDFMDSLNHDNQADVIEAFNSTSRYTSMTF